MFRVLIFSLVFHFKDEPKEKGYLLEYLIACYIKNVTSTSYIRKMSRDTRKTVFGAIETGPHSHRRRLEMVHVSERRLVLSVKGLINKL